MKLKVIIFFSCLVMYSCAGTTTGRRIPTETESTETVSENAGLEEFEIEEVEMEEDVVEAQIPDIEIQNKVYLSNLTERDSFSFFLSKDGVDWKLNELGKGHHEFYDVNDNKLLYIKVITRADPLIKKVYRLTEKNKYFIDWDSQNRHFKVVKFKE